MSDPYVGELRLTAASFAPEGWFLCDGRLIDIALFETLYTLIGTTYGGDGQSTFGLPDLRGRVAVHQGSGAFGNYVIGALGGEESVTVAVQFLGPHQHQCQASSTPAGNLPGAALLSDERAPQAPGVLAYVSPQASVTTLSPVTLGLAGYGRPHENRQPFIALNYMIAWTGIFPQPD